MPVDFSGNQRAVESMVIIAKVGSQPQEYGVLFRVIRHLGEAVRAGVVQLLAPHQALIC